jgi:ATP-binding cassette subfamily C (CFTR/MRP) protein 1
VLDKGGKIAEQGTFDKLNGSGGYTSGFDLALPDWNITSQKNEYEAPPRYSERQVAKQTTEEDVQAEANRRTGDASIYKYYVGSVGWIPTIIFIISIIIFIFGVSFPSKSLKSPRFGSILTDYSQQYGSRSGRSTTKNIPINILGIILVYTPCLVLSHWSSWSPAAGVYPNSLIRFTTLIHITGSLSSRWYHDLAYNFTNDFSILFLRKLMRSQRKCALTEHRSPMSFFSTVDTGVTLNRFSQDLMLIDMELPITALNTFASQYNIAPCRNKTNVVIALVLCIAQMALIAVAAPFAAISFPIVGITVYFIQRFYLRTSRQLRFLDLEAKSPLYTQFNETLEGLATIRAFGWQSFVEEKAKALLDRSQRPFYLLFAVQRWLTLVLDFVVAGVATILIILVVVLRGKLSAGYVGVAMLNVVLFSQSIKLLISFWTQLETHIGSVARIKNFTTETVAEDQETEDHIPPPNWPSEGKIEFNDITAYHRAGEPVIQDFSLSIDSGEKVAIVGRTGR